MRFYAYDVQVFLYRFKKMHKRLVFKFSFHFSKISRHVIDSQLNFRYVCPLSLCTPPPLFFPSGGRVMYSQIGFTAFHC